MATMSPAWFLLVVFIHQWHGSQCQIVDIEPPKFTFCPPETSVESSQSTVRVTWDAPKVTDNTGMAVQVTSNRQPGEEFKVPGSYLIQYKAVDVSGYLAVCNFVIHTKHPDTEAPKFISCPPDQEIESEMSTIRVHWDPPQVSDNSGIAPTISSSRQSGDLFGVPGAYQVAFTARDASGNTAECSFTIITKKKTCAMFSPPIDGSLKCLDINGEPFCSVACKKGTDFAFNPPLVYYCVSGTWNFWAFPGLPFETRLPWPDCSAQANPSWLNSQGILGFSYTGDCNDPNVMDGLKQDYWNFLRGPFVPPVFCLTNSNCRKESIVIHCGKSSSVNRR